MRAWDVRNVGWNEVRNFGGYAGIRGVSELSLGLLKIKHDDPLFVVRFLKTLFATQPMSFSFLKIHVRVIQLIGVLCDIQNPFILWYHQQFRKQSCILAQYKYHIKPFSPALKRKIEPENIWTKQPIFPDIFIIVHKNK